MNIATIQGLDIFIFLLVMGIIALIIIYIKHSTDQAEIDEERKKFEDRINTKFQYVEDSVEKAKILTVEDVFNMKKNNAKNVIGVYMIYNKNKDKYYFGQSLEAINATLRHFTGKGNGDIFVDYNNGDEFSIRIIELRNTTMVSLDKLKAYMIEKYVPEKLAYNKKKGNLY